MANVYYTNFTLQSANHGFSAIWKLTRALKKSGWTYKAGSDGVTKESAGVTDPWGNSADPSSDSYVTTNLDATYTTATGPWIVLSTPSTSKIPFVAASTGTFLRGEKITQAVSGAEGELVGYDFDSVGLVGHIVVIPRTGTFNNSNVITGISSGATLTPSGTIVNFVKEVCFWKSGASSGTTGLVNGSIYFQTVDASAENTSRFSYLAANSAGCTATVCPGGGGTANGLPSLGTYVMMGTTTGGTSPTITHTAWFGMTTGMGKAQIVSTNAIPATNVSPDLTWWIVLGDTSTAIGAQMFGHFRCDNSEDGDLDPFVTYIPTNSGTTTRLAAASVALTGNITAAFFTSGPTSTAYGWKGWRRRGFSSGDAYTGLSTAQLAFAVGGLNVLTNNNANPESIACSNTTKRLRDKIWILSVDNTLKIRKGNPRWLDLLQAGTPYDTLDNKLRLCFIGFSGTSFPSVFVGPYDSTTTPLQS